MKKEKNNKSILEESLIDFQAIQNMMAKTSEATIKNIVSEKIKDGLKDMITEADDFDEEEVDVNDAEENEDGVDDASLDSDENLENGSESGENDDDDLSVDVVDDEGGAGTELIDDDGDGEDDFNFDEFKTGEDEYDLTNNSIEDVVKVFKKISDDDSIVVKKLENGKVELIDNEAETEYLIDMGDDDGDIEIELDDEEEISVDDDDLSDETEIEIELGDEDEDVSEKNMTQSIGTNRRAGRMTQTRKSYAPGANNRDGSKLITAENKKIAEAYAQKIKQIEDSYANKFKQLNEEVSKYKQALVMFRDKLKENAVLNNNLAKYVKLVTENATTKSEKIQILERFAKEANTIEAGNKLFESINDGLSKKINPEINIDKQFSVSTHKKLDEQVIYQSKDLQKTIGLIDRMNSLR